MAAFGLFRRDAVIGAGGYARDTVDEDMELVARVRRRGYGEQQPRRVEFVPAPVARTEVPATLRALGRQRDRWHCPLTDDIPLVILSDLSADETLPPPVAISD